MMIRTRSVALVCSAVAVQLGPACRQDTGFIPADSNILFRDEFNSEVLGKGWTLKGNDTSRFTLTDRPGHLRVYPQEFSADSEDAEASLLLRDFTGDFVLTALLEFEPLADRQLAGLFVEAEDGLSVSFGLISADFTSDTFVGFSLVADRGPDAGPDTVFEVFDEPSVYVRLARTGDSFRGAYSRDGRTYYVVGTVTNALPTAVSVGLGAFIRENCERDCQSPGPADFDFFEIGSADVEGDG